MGWGIATLSRVSREGLSPVIFEERLEGSERSKSQGYVREECSKRWNNKCKDPELGKSQAVGGRPVWLEAMEDSG